MSIDMILPNATQLQYLANIPGDTLDMTSEPEIQTQTITSTKAKIPSSEKAGRQVMIIKNLDEIRQIRVGGTSITTKKGFLLEPQSSVKILLNPESPEDVWGVAVGAEVKVEVIEL